MCLLSRFLVIRTVGSQRSKKQNCSTRRQLRVDTNLVEFRQLQEVGIFSYFVYSLAKSHMVRDILRLDLAVNLVSKPLNRVEKISNLVVVNSNPRVSLFMCIVT